MSTPVEGRIDYAAVAQSPEFQELVARRRRFVTTALAFAVAWFGTFVLLTAYAHEFMQTIIVSGLSVAYVLGLSQFVLVWALTAAYLRTSTSTFEPMQAGVVRAGRAPEAAAR
jgi:uncharacterized membrane protein (DUF485 family)